MAFPWTWQSDEEGAYNLRGPQGEHLWILPRQPYCDRGHWQLGTLGVHLPEPPSLYFHHFARAQREAELWLLHAQGHPLPPETVAFPAAWTENAPGRWERTVPQPQGDIVFRIEQEGPLWIWSVPQGLDHHPGALDAADAFPRRFLRATHAIEEAAAFERWRLHQEPAEHPSRQARPDEPVPPAIQALLSPDRPRRRLR